MGTNISISLDDWQLEAIQRLFGMEIHEDGTVTEFPRDLVEKQIEKITKWSIVVND